MAKDWKSGLSDDTVAVMESLGSKVRELHEGPPPTEPVRETIRERIRRMRTEKDEPLFGTSGGPSQIVIARRTATRIYFIEAVGTDRVKIGDSGRTISRFSFLQDGCPFPLKVIGSTSKYSKDDIFIRFGGSRTLGEWFFLTPDIRKFLLEHGDTEGE